MGQHLDLTNKVDQGATILLSDKTESGDAPKLVKAELSWDMVPSAPKKYDLDLSCAIGGADGLVGSAADVAYFDNTRIIWKDTTGNDIEVVRLSKDNRDGQGDGPDEWAKINLEALTPEKPYLYVIVNIDKAALKGQSFAEVATAVLRLIDRETDKELALILLGRDFAAFTGVYAARFQKVGNEYKFTNVSKGSNGQIADIIQNEGLS